MERVLADIPQSYCVIYLDDLVTHAADFVGALANLRDFTRLRSTTLG